MLLTAVSSQRTDNTALLLARPVATAPSMPSSREPAERELVARLQRGEDAAYEELVRQYGGAMLAVARRLETVVDQYSGLGYDEKVLFQLHDVYGKLNDKSRAEDALRKIISRFPGTPAASRAQQMLGS